MYVPRASAVDNKSHAFAPAAPGVPASIAAFAASQECACRRGGSAGHNGRARRWHSGRRRVLLCFAKARAMNLAVWRAAKGV
eukprot:2279318-Pleurochrysis_carterae.AAC.2